MNIEIIIKTLIILNILVYSVLLYIETTHLTKVQIVEYPPQVFVSDRLNLTGNETLQEIIEIGRNQ